MTISTEPVFERLNAVFLEYSKDAIKREGELYTIRLMEKHATYMAFQELIEITNNLTSRYNSLPRLSGERRAMEPYVKMTHNAWGGKVPMIAPPANRIIDVTTGLVNHLNVPSKNRTYNDRPVYTVVEAKKSFAAVQQFFYNRVSF